MPLYPIQKKTLERFISSYVSNIVRLYISPSDSAEAIERQKRDEIKRVFESLCANDQKHRFWSNAPEKWIIKERALYGFWALMHKPEELAQELGWIKQGSPPEETRSVLLEIQTTARTNYSMVCDSLITAFIEQRAKEGVRTDEMEGCSDRSSSGEPEAPETDDSSVGEIICESDDGDLDDPTPSVKV